MKNYQTLGLPTENEVSSDNGTLQGTILLCRKVYEKCLSLNEQAPAVILYGAPGTGKTVSIKNLSGSKNWESWSFRKVNAGNFTADSLSPIPVLENGHFKKAFMVDAEINNACNTSNLILFCDEFDRVRNENLQRLIEAYSDGNSPCSPEKMPFLILAGNGGYDNTTFDPENNIKGRAVILHVFNESTNTAYNKKMNIPSFFGTLATQQAKRNAEYYSTPQPCNTATNKRAVLWCSLAIEACKETPQCVPFLETFIYGLFESETACKVITQVELAKHNLPCIYDLDGYIIKDNAPLLARHVELLTRDITSDNDVTAIRNYLNRCGNVEQLEAFEDSARDLTKNLKF